MVHGCLYLGWHFIALIDFPVLIFHLDFSWKPETERQNVNIGNLTTCISIPRLIELYGHLPLIQELFWSVSISFSVNYRLDCCKFYGKYSRGAIFLVFARPCCPWRCYMRRSWIRRPPVPRTCANQPKYLPVASSGSR